MSEKRYKITITEEVVEIRIRGKNWERGAGDDEGDDNYGYTPEIEKKVEVTREIFSQNTSELDLKAVIKAINGL